jgi:hypothetical protein
MNLLHAHILKQNPDALVYTSSSWPRGPPQTDSSLNERLLAVDPEYPNPPSLTFLLFDEGQESYGDLLLWNSFFKGVGNGAYKQYRVILFCYYGSPGSRPLSYRLGAPLILGANARISLLPGKQSVGLLLNREEFTEVVSKFGGINLHNDLQDMMFNWTAGHVGAVVKLLDIMACQVSLLSRNLNYSDFSIVCVREETRNAIHS